MAWFSKRKRREAESATPAPAPVPVLDASAIARTPSTSSRSDEPAVVADALLREGSGDVADRADEIAELTTDDDRTAEARLEQAQDEADAAPPTASRLRGLSGSHRVPAVPDSADAVPTEASPAKAGSSDVVPANGAPSATPLRGFGARRVPAADEPREGAMTERPVAPREESVPVPRLGATAAASVDDASLYRTGPRRPVGADPEATRILPRFDPDATQLMAAADLPAPPDPIAAERARLERERAARREARLAALDPVREEDPLAAPVAVVTPSRPVRPSTDRWAPSLGLFLLRAVSALILGVTGLNGLLINQQNVIDTWSRTIIPSQYSAYAAKGVSAAEVLLAFLLLFGMATRLAGLALAVLMGLILALVMWGPWSIFDRSVDGFLGQHELLLAAVGLLLLLVGAGGWSIDAMWRHSREKEALES